MLKKLAYLSLVAGTLATLAVACTDGPENTTKPDFATSVDGMGNSDMNVTKMYAPATPNAIDTNTIGGSLGKGAAVQLTGVIVLAPPTGFSANQDKDCKYQVFAQDPMCTTPPCGLVVVTKAITNPNGAGKFCPFASDTMTPLKDVWKGDKIDVKGVVDTFASTAMAPATGTVVQHEVEVDELIIAAKNQTVPTPMVVTDTDPSKFVPYSGSGWAMYEGTYIKLQPASGKFTTTLDSFGGWNCAPGGAHFADSYTGFFRPDGAAANMWPVNGSTFASISGIVALTFGGGILPTSNSDFVP